MDSSSKVKLIAGIFVSMSIISTVLACALWDFPANSTISNSLYFGKFALFCFFFVRFILL
ncbi:unnamed protein product [Haemonchus placei]|uniref:Vesicle transport protein n=1 Tax=Haemonchus placei TaxID=6290 RepID=A0A0N4VWC1_HAEPC|nr:unnamed protein product [Haemonchus placei]